MLATRIFILTSTLFILTYSNGQVSLSFGFSNKFQTDNNYDNDGNAWFGGRITSKVREQYLTNSYSLGADFQRNKFNLVVDMCLWANKLTVNSTSYSAHGSQTGSNSTSRTYDYSINYGYLGVKISPQRVYEIKENFDILLGPFFQFQLRMYEREYNHLTTVEHYSSYYNPWAAGGTGAYESTTTSSTNTDEFNRMDLTRESGLLGLYLYPKMKFNKCFVSLNLSGGFGFTSRRDLTDGKAAWEDKIYGFGEVGFKFGYIMGGK